MDHCNAYPDGEAGKWTQLHAEKKKGGVSVPKPVPAVGQSAALNPWASVVASQARIASQTAPQPQVPSGVTVNRASNRPIFPLLRDSRDDSDSSDSEEYHTERRSRFRRDRDDSSDDDDVAYEGLEAARQILRQIGAGD